MPALVALGIIGDALDLVAVRSGVNGDALVHQDDGSAIPDSGSLDYAYDGTSGSTALTVEDWVSPDDEIEVQVYDAVAQAPAPGWTVSGAPGTGVLARAAASDPIGDTDGLSPCSPGNLPSGPLLPDASTGSLAIYFPRIAATRLLTDPDSATAGLRTFQRAGDVRVQVRTDPAGANGLLLEMLDPSPTAGTRMVLVVEYDNTTPGGSDGTLRARLYRAGDGSGGSAVLVDSDSGVYSFSNIDWTRLHRVGVTDSDAISNDMDQSGVVIDTWPGRLITDGDPTAIADGTDPTGGLVGRVSLNGYRSGVVDPAQPTRLIVRDRLGDAPVTAVNA